MYYYEYLAWIESVANLGRSNTELQGIIEFYSELGTDILNDPDVNPSDKITLRVKLLRVITSLKVVDDLGIRSLTRYRDNFNDYY